MSRIARAAVISMIVLLAPIAAYAQATIAGVVSDNSGAVLANVAVEVSGAALAGKARAATTDSPDQASSPRNPAANPRRPPQTAAETAGLAALHDSARLC